MPLTEKGQKIKGAMEKQYGPEKGEKVFYASKNKGKISGVDDAHKARHIPGRTDGSWRVDIEFPGERSDNIKKLISHCDSLVKRLDAFEDRQHQRKPKDVKPRTKDNMQPSMAHPKEPGG